MQRICATLAEKGFDIVLIGRQLKNSAPLLPERYTQKRLPCIFSKGFLFYTEYNTRLFFWLLFRPMDAICAIDLDTILPCYFISLLRRKKRIYDAHELFSEQKEILRRPSIHLFWLAVEKLAVPRFQYGYTVSSSICNELKKRYHVEYAIIRNLPLKTTLASIQKQKRLIIYQGSVNEARGLENLVIAMKNVDAVLHIYGDGNIYSKIVSLIREHGLQQKIILKGKLVPAELRQKTLEASIGINLVEPVGLNQLYSLANKFFDYIQAAVPQVTMNFPEYQLINQKFEVALLMDTINSNAIAEKLNLLLCDNILYNKLQSNCLKARETYHWQDEQKKLIRFYQDLFKA